MRNSCNKKTLMFSNVFKDSDESVLKVHLLDDD